MIFIDFDCFLLVLMVFGDFHWFLKFKPLALIKQPLAVTRTQHHTWKAPSLIKHTEYHKTCMYLYYIYITHTKSLKSLTCITTTTHIIHFATFRMYFLQTILHTIIPLWLYCNYAISSYNDECHILCIHLYCFIVFCFIYVCIISIVAFCTNSVLARYLHTCACSLNITKY